MAGTGVTLSYDWNGTRYRTEADMLAAMKAKEQQDLQQQRNTDSAAAQNGVRASSPPSNVMPNPNPASVQPTYVDPNNPNTQGSNITQNAYESERLQGMAANQQQQQLAATGAQKTDQMNLAARLQADAEARRLGYLSQVQQQQPQVTRPGMATDEAGARAAAFARAKEQAGQTAGASLKALGDVMAERGLSGSTVENNATNSLIGQGAGSVDEFTREQLMQDLNRAASLSDQTYQGNITQRGQNLAMVPSLMGLITASSGLY